MPTPTGPSSDAAATSGASGRRIRGERVGEVIFLDRVDGELANDAATRTEMVRAIRRLRPTSW